MTIRAVLFDKDGTLLDFDATFGPAAHAVLSELCAGDAATMADLATIAGYDLATRKFARDSIIFANATGDYAPFLAERLGIACDDALISRIDRLLEENSVRHTATLPGAAELLADLAAAGILTACITNDTESCARAQLATVGIATHLKDVIGYDTGHGWKPDPGQINAFAQMHGLGAHEIAFVGDSLHDMHAAKAAGVLAIGVTTGMHEREVLAEHADHVVEVLGEVLGVVGGG